MKDDGRKDGWMEGGREYHKGGENATRKERELKEYGFLQRKDLIMEIQICFLRVMQEAGSERNI